jgi:PIN domain nuclease of toxin-antitoxin system
MSKGYLLDTCAWLDLNIAPELISKPARAIIRKTDYFALSSISVLEVSRKASLGKLTLSLSLEDWLEIALSAKRIRQLPISPEIAIEAYRLPGDFQPDPADRIIVATARRNQLTLLTSDQRILDYPHVQSVASR